jgi:hypothetical protein
VGLTWHKNKMQSAGKLNVVLLEVSHAFQVLNANALREKKRIFKKESREKSVNRACKN